MMDKLRESVNGIGMKIILGLIILSFMIGGISSYLIGGGANTAAEVNGEAITLQQLEQAYANERTAMQQQLGESFYQFMSDPSTMELMRQQALNKLVSTKLIEQYADKLGLYVGNKQVSNVLHTIPAFQQNGQFDQQTYAAAVRASYGMSTSQFAEMLKIELMRDQLLTALEQSEFVLPSDLELPVNLLSQKREIQTITLDQSVFAKQASVTDEEIENYYQINQQQFLQPETFKLSYLELSAQKLAQDIKVTNEELQAYYKEHLAEYETKESRQLAHIQVTDEAQAKDILEKLKAGEDFAELAKSFSQDSGSASKGGDLGWVDQGMLEADFDQTAFALSKAGDLSSIVKSSVGFHIIKLEAVKKASTKSFNEVKSAITTSLKDQKAANEFYRLQSDMEKYAFDSPDDLNAAAEAIKGKISELADASLESLPQELATDAVRRALNNQDVRDGYNSKPLELAPEHLVVVRMDDIQAPHTLTIDEVRSDIKQTLANQKAQQQISELSQSLLAGLTAEDDSVVSKNKLRFSASKVVDRQNPLNVFSMPRPENGKATYTSLQDENSNTVIVKLVNVIEGKASDQEREALQTQLERAITSSNMESILKSLNDNADVSYNALPSTQPL